MLASVCTLPSGRLLGLAGAGGERGMQTPVRAPQAGGKASARAAFPGGRGFRSRAPSDEEPTLQEK